MNFWMWLWLCLFLDNSRKILNLLKIAFIGAVVIFLFSFAFSPSFVQAKKGGGNEEVEETIEEVAEDPEPAVVKGEYHSGHGNIKSSLSKKTEEDLDEEAFVADNDGLKISFDDKQKTENYIKYEVINLEGKDRSLKWKFIDGDKVNLVKENSSKILYSNVWSDVDIETTIEKQGMKKDVIVKSLQPKTSFGFEIQSNKINLSLKDDGRIVGTDSQTGEYLLMIPAPKSRDSAGYPIETHFTLEEKNGDKYILTKYLDSDLGDLEPDTNTECSEEEITADEDLPEENKVCADGQKHIPIQATYPVYLDANIYSSPIFEVDTSANVADLTTLKGSAPDASDTLYVFATDANDVTFTIEQDFAIGAVYLGQDFSAGNTTYDSFIVQNENTTFDITGDFTIKKASDVSSYNQYSTSGTDSTLNTILQINGNIYNYDRFIMDDNDVVKLTSDSTSSSNIKGLLNYNTGYLEIKGSKDTNGTATSNTSETVLEDTSKGWALDEQNGKRIKITSGRAFGKTYDVVDTTADTLVRADNSSNSTISVVTWASRKGRITCSTDCVTSNDQHVSRYIKFTSGALSGNYYQIVDSTNSSNYIYVVENLPTLGALASDTFTITDGLVSGDTYDVYDYAVITATTQDSTHRGYIYAQQDSETVIQYADISYMGMSASNKYGISVYLVDSSQANEGFSIQDSEVSNSYYGIYLSSSSYNTLTSNNAYSNGYGIYLYGLCSNNYFSGDFLGVLGNNQYDIIVSNSPSYPFTVSAIFRNVVFTGTTEVGSLSNLISDGAYIISQNHNTTKGLTKIWGDYSFTGTKQFNYADQSYSAYSSTPKSMAGSSSMSAVTTSDVNTVTEYWKAVYDSENTNWVITGSVSGVQTAKASNGVQYTSDGGEVIFTITESSPSNGDIIDFVTIASAGDANTQKVINVGDSGIGSADQSQITVPLGSTLEMKGTSDSHTLVTRDSANSDYYGLTIEGTIDAQYYDFDYLNTSGLTINSGATLTDLTYGDFGNVQSGGSHLTFSGMTATFSNIVFDSTGTYDITATSTSAITINTPYTRGNALDVEGYNSTINWENSPSQPTITFPFDNRKATNTIPYFDFTTSDSQSDDLVYEFQWDTDFYFTSPTSRTSDVNDGFQNLSSPSDTSPFTSGENIRFTIQAGDALTDENTYWWRVRAKDSGGTDIWSPWSVWRSFTIDTSVTDPVWHQTGMNQFGLDTLTSGRLNTVDSRTTGDIRLGQDNPLIYKQRLNVSNSVENVFIDENYLYTNEYDSYVRVYSLSDLSLYDTLNVGSQFQGLYLSNDKLYAFGQNGYVRIWNLSSINGTGASYDATVDTGSGLNYSLIGNDNYFFVGSSDDNIYVYNKSNNSLYDTLDTGTGSVKSLYLDSSKLYAGTSQPDGDIRIWNLSSINGTGASYDATINSSNLYTYGLSGDDNYLYAVGYLQDYTYVYNKSDNSLYDSLNRPSGWNSTYGTANTSEYVFAVGGDNLDDGVVAYQKSNIDGGGVGPSYGYSYFLVSDKSCRTVHASSTQGTFIGCDDDTVYIFSATNPVSGIATSTAVSWANMSAEGATKWGSFSWTDDETNGDIKYKLYYDNGGTITLIPDGDLVGNSSGFDDSPVDISGLSVATYSTLYIVADFTDSGLGTPILQDWTITSTTNIIPDDPSSLGSSSHIDSSWGNDNTPTLSFAQSDSDVDNTVQYIIQIDDTSDYSSPVIDYTSALASQGSTSFTVGQAGGSGTYTIGSEGQTLSDGSYYWRVKTIDNGSSASSWANATGTGIVAFKVDVTAPTNIEIFSLSADSSGQITAISLTASDAGSSLHSTPYWFTETTGETGGTSSTDWQSSNTFIDSGLSPNVQYTYKVKAKDTLNNESSFSAVSSVYTLANTPASLSLVVDSSSQITASWSANSNPVGTEYYIENTTAGTNSGWTTNLSWVSSGLNSETIYPFRIKARNGDGLSTGWSESSAQTISLGGGGIPGSVGGGGGNMPTSRLQIIYPDGTVVYITEKIKNIVESVTPSFLESKPVVSVKTIEEKMADRGIPLEPIEEAVTKETPLSMNEEMFIAGEEVLDSLMVTPLVFKFGFIEEKFPELKKKFEELNVKSLSDIKGLQKGETISLPKLAGITTSIPLSFGVKRISLSGMSQEAKNNIPTEVVFARSDGESMDLNVEIGENDEGETHPLLRSTVGNLVKLVFKPNFPAKSIEGYLTFSKRSRRVSLSASVAYATMEDEFVVSKFKYIDEDGDGIFTADIAIPKVDGEYEIATIVDYKDEKIDKKEIKMIIVVDPEGYVYETVRGKEVRVKNSVVSIYSLNSETGKFEKWNAIDFKQENPQITSKTGSYSFLVPEGEYYLSVEADGYHPYKGDVFKVKEGEGIHVNIELKSTEWNVGGFGTRDLVIAGGGMMFVLLILGILKSKIF